MKELPRLSRRDAIARLLVPAFAALQGSALVAQTQEPDEFLGSVGFVARVDKPDRVRLRRDEALRLIQVRSGTPVFPGDIFDVADGAEVVIVYPPSEVTQILKGNTRMMIPGRPPADPAILRRLWSRLPRSIRNYFEPLTVMENTSAGHRDPMRGPLRPDSLLPPGRYRLSSGVNTITVFWRGFADNLAVYGADLKPLDVLGTQGTAKHLVLPNGMSPVKIVVVSESASRSLTWEIERSGMPPVASRDGPSDPAEFVYALDLIGTVERPAPDNGAWRLEGLSRLAVLATRYFPAELVLTTLRRRSAENR